jgi:Flp pilus assembly protein TadB
MARDREGLGRVRHPALPNLDEAGPELNPLRTAEQASDAIRAAGTREWAAESDRARRAGAGPMTLHPDSTDAADRSPRDQRGRVPRRVMAVYAVTTVGLAAVYLLVPALGVVAWALIVLLSTAAFAVGIVRNRPRRRFPWVFLAAGYLTFAIGTVVALLVPAGQFPSRADVVFLGI